MHHSHRDQLSFSFAAWKVGLEYKAIPGGSQSGRFLKHAEHATSDAPMRRAFRRRQLQATAAAGMTQPPTWPRLWRPTAA
jgi:hypothetical protein